MMRPWNLLELCCRFMRQLKPRLFDAVKTKGQSAQKSEWSMKFLSFLKKAETDMAKVLEVAAKAEPAAVGIGSVVAIAAGHPEIALAFQKIGAVVTGAGALVTTVQGEQGTGAQKLQIAAPLVDQLIKNSGFLNGKQIADTEKWEKAVAGIAGYTADLYASVVPAVTAGQGELKAAAPAVNVATAPAPTPAAASAVAGK